MTLFDDIRLALRAFSKRPGFTATVVGTLALGIGATTTVFSVVHAVMLKPLPYANPERLVNVYRLPITYLANNSAPAAVGAGYWIPPSVVSEWEASAQVFDALGGYMTDTQTFRIGDEPETLQMAMATSGVFTTLGVRPLLGGVLSAEDDRIGAPRRVVLSHAFWQSRYGGDHRVLGRVMTSGGAPYTIIGVMPPGFGFPYGTEDVWIALDDGRRSFASRKSGFLQVIARMKPGVTLVQARAAMEHLSRALARAHPEDTDFAVGVIPRLEVVSAGSGRSLLLLLAAVGTVLLIAASNVANLLFIRASDRRRETGLRQALGAPRARLLTQCLVESLVLALAGGLAGCAIAAAGVAALVRKLPVALPRADEIHVDSRVLLFGLALSLAVGVLVGVLPALRATTVPVLDALRDGGRAVAGGRRRSRVQTALVASQVALVFVLLAATGLLIRSLAELNRVDMGFDAGHVLTVNASVPAPDTPVDAATRDDQARTFFRELTARLTAIPSVRWVGGAVQLPTFGWSIPPAIIESSAGPVRFNVHSTAVTPSFFRAMGIRLVSGRSFTEDDRAGTEPVAVVSRGFVRRFWPDGNPLGRRVKIDSTMWPGGPEPRWLTVVGVVADVRFSPGRDPMPTVYQAHAQSPARSMIFVLRTENAPAGIAPAAMAAVRAVNRNIVVRSFTLNDRIREGQAMVSRRFTILLLSVLGAMATVLALLGIYAALAYSVAQRTREIGIRVALGASRAAVVRQVVSLALGMAGIGLAAGIACALAASRTLRSVLFGVSPTDPATLLSATLLVAVVAVAASLVPARRATSVDPITALRSE